MRMWLGIGILAFAALVLLLSANPGRVLGVTSAEFAGLAKAVALLIVIGGGALLAYRGRAHEAVKHAAIWLGIALLLLVVYSYRAEFAEVAYRIAGELIPGMPVAATIYENGDSRRIVTIRADRSGHFNVRAQVNGVNLDMIVDTGASLVTLTRNDARRVGIRDEELIYSVTVQTANGITQAAPVTLDSVTVGDITQRDVRALVIRGDALFTNLLGMNFLRTIGGFEITGDTLVLRH